MTTSAAASTTPRPVSSVVRAQPASDGAGVRLHRSLGTPKLPMVDPFLMLDEFRSDNPGDYIAGFPSHPHRGFETVTIMLAGSMQHKDSVGNTGNLGPGSVQWMTAGRGIIHSEMPRQEDGLMWGFQLWVNLRAQDKMTPPRYQDIGAEEIPTVQLGDGLEVRVMAGEVGGARGPIEPGYTDPVLLDVRLAPSKRLVHPLPRGHNAFLYIYEGQVRLTGHDAAVGRGHAVVLGEGDHLEVEALDGDEARFLVVAGRPIQEPVARYGPFVMNSAEEIQQAFADYQAGRLTR